MPTLQFRPQRLRMGHEPIQSIRPPMRPASRHEADYLAASSAFTAAIAGNANAVELSAAKAAWIDALADFDRERGIAHAA